jgi:hypothetical protein
MEEFKVKVKDLKQDCVHKFTVLANSKQEANQTAIKMLKGVLKHDEFEIKSCELNYRKYTYTGDAPNRTRASKST